ncbi:DUF3109 family protein [Alloprevotella tannerae]|uniref:DUF3109 family protein n=1 Tax=Alloprevotella tannerae TaxID=76122 RepID=UPI0028E383E6|nr:DUF3109 family protein [Alloprevotella tannerae]
MHTSRREIPILQVGKVLLSTEIVTEYFCCDLSACHGQCCVDGESGAPLTLDEAAELERLLPTIEDSLSAEAREVIAARGVAYVDVEGDLVTSIVNGQDCVFTCYEDGCCLCAAERAYREQLTDWCKPISCALYPIREKRLSNGYVGLNYHRWSVCDPARRKGQELRLPLYRFLKAPLTRRFGEAWYKELEATVDALQAMKQ